MKSLKQRSALLLTIAFIFSQAIVAQVKTSDIDLPNFYQVNANLYRGGQPTKKGIERLEGKVKTIIYLRGADEKAKQEEGWARQVGINFINVSLNNWFGPKDAKIDEILKLIDAPENQPVFVHCQRGADRTGTIIAVYRITHDKYTAKEAIAEAKRFRFGWWQFWMEDYVKDFYRDFQKKN